MRGPSLTCCAQRRSKRCATFRCCFARRQPFLRFATMSARGRSNGKPVEYLDAVRYTQWFNTLGAPAVVVPVGASPEGLPIGVQIAARPFEDEVALGIAAIVDEAFGFRPPPMARA